MGSRCASTRVAGWSSPVAAATACRRLDAAFSPDGDVLFGLNGNPYDHTVYIGRTDTGASVVNVSLNLPSTDPDPKEIVASADGNYVLIYTNTSNGQSPKIMVLAQQ